MRESREEIMVQEMGNAHSEGKRGISGSTLKLIALLTMLVDHVGAVVVVRMIIDNNTRNGMVGMIAYDNLYITYQVLRSIGRIAFPIYCFLLVEGFQRTRNKAKYAFRLGLFALISEIPFDLAFSSKVLEFSYQNVFFTLFIGMITMLAMDAVEKKMRSIASEKAVGFMTAVKYLAELTIFATGAFVAELLRTDYGAKGIMCIVVLYLFRWNKAMQIVAGACAFLWERTASFAFIPIAFYNGRRGLNLKYVFYLFYPLHLLILYLVCVVMGISGYPTL